MRNHTKPWKPKKTKGKTQKHTESIESIEITDSNHLLPEASCWCCGVGVDTTEVLEREESDGLTLCLAPLAEYEELQDGDETEREDREGFVWCPGGAAEQTEVTDGGGDA